MKDRNGIRTVAIALLEFNPPDAAVSEFRGTIVPLYPCKVVDPMGIKAE